MHLIRLEIIKSLFVEYSTWFGSPALLRLPPDQIDVDRPNCTQILDGLTRFRALRQNPELLDAWRKGKFPHYIFPEVNALGIYSTRGAKVLPRMLILAGHYDRAYEHVPEAWRDTIPLIKTFCQVHYHEAELVWEAREHFRQRAYVPPIRRRNHRETIHTIRMRLDRMDQDGEPFTMADLRKLVSK